MPMRPPQTRAAHRSVHFAPSVAMETPPVPPQPPSSPNQSDEDLSVPPTSWQGGYPGTARQEVDNLMVIGKSTKATPGGTPGTQHLNPPGRTTLTPRLPGPRPGSPERGESRAREGGLEHASTSQSKSAKSGYDPCDQGYDFTVRTSDQSGRTSCGTKSTTSSNSQGSSVRTAKRIFQEGQLESPAPPPPSPEPRDLNTATPMSHFSKQASSLAMVAEESESGITISANPPSNLDSVSRIPSPPLWEGSRPLTVGTIEESGLLDSREATNLSAIANTDGRESTNPEIRAEEVTSLSLQDGLLDGQQAGLDQFGVTEESLKEELEGEYRKLARQL